MKPDSRLTGLLAMVTGSLVTMLVRRLTAGAWRAATHEDPPDRQDDPSLRRLLIWVGLSAAVAGVTSTLIRTGVRRMTGDD